MTKICAALVVLLLSTGAFAQVPAGATGTVSEGPLGQPAIAVDPTSGRYIVAFGSFEIFGRRFDRDGTPLGPEFLISDGPGLGSFDVTAAANRDGTALLVWSHQSGHIHGHVYSREGVARGPEFRVDSTTAGFYPVVASLAGGGFVVAWQSWSDVGAIAGRRFDSGGRPLGRDFEVAAAQNTTLLGNTTVAAGPDGSFLVAWQSRAQGVLARRFSADGQPGEPHVVAP